MTCARRGCALALAAAALAPLGPRAVASSACPDADLQPFPGNLDRVRHALVCEINVRRVDSGLPPLTDRAQLDASAQFHTDDMVESHFLAHQAPGHPALVTRIRRTGYFRRVTTAIFSENIAAAPQEEASAATVVEAWMLSPEHRDKILYGRFRDLGVGARVAGPDPAFYADRPSVVYTTDFGRRYPRRRCHARRAAAGGGPIRYCSMRRAQG
ncbi:MAG: CAP domain-containing protein [Thermoleophilaceae bacterium]